MSILSGGFLYLFVPLGLLIYWRLCGTARQKLAALALLSLGFYALADVPFLPLLIALSLITFLSARMRRSRVGILVNLLALGYFKYADWGASSSLALNGINIFTSVAVPLGISFYVFKHIGYLFDVERGVVEPTDDLLLFVTFSALFFQITAGPLSRFEQLATQVKQLPATLDRDRLYQGLVYLTYGLFKKLLIADALIYTLTLSQNTNPMIGSFLGSWQLITLLALQLYFDFSGYTDIVLGLGFLFGLELPPNFDNPFMSGNPREFWQRWHISLSTWIQTYVFTPLSRWLLKRRSRLSAEMIQYAVTIVTMTIMGLWHGADAHFVLWGVAQGVLLSAYSWGQRHKINLHGFGRLLFLIAFWLSWALFFFNTSTAVQVIEAMIGLHGLGTFAALPDGTVIVLIGAVLLILADYTEAVKLPPMRGLGFAVGLGILAALCLLNLGTASGFLYARF